MPTIEQLAKWLEEDGHPACAEDLLMAKPENRVQAALDAAHCAESDPDRYDDNMSRELPGQLREWASSQIITIQPSPRDALADDIVSEAIAWAERLPVPLSVALAWAETWLAIMPCLLNLVDVVADQEARELQDQIDRMAGESLIG